VSENPVEKLWRALSSRTSQRLVARFGLLSLMTIVLCAPYGIPAIWDQIRTLWGASGTSYYLLKPVENQTFFIQFAVVAIGLPYVLWRAWVLPTRLARNSILWFATLFFAVQAYSLLAAPNPGHAFRAFLLPLCCFLAFLLVQSLSASPRQLERIFLVAVIGAVPAALYAILQSAGYELLPYATLPTESALEDMAGKQKISSTFGHPNYMGSYMAPLLYWALFFVFEMSRKWLKWVVGISGAIILVALILSGARGPWLGILGAALPYYVLLALSPRYRRQLLFAGGVGLILIVIVLTVPLPFLKFQFNLLERLAASREVNVRFYYWLIALEMLRAKPWFGVGYGQYNVLFWNYVDFLQSRKGSEVYQYILAEQIRGVSPGYVHNDWLQFATESGVVGLAVWCALWAALLAQSWETARRAANKPRVHLMAATFLASFAVIGLDGLFNFPLHIPVSMFFFWLSLGVWIVFRAQVGQEHQFLVVTEEPRTVQIEALRDVPRIGQSKPRVRLKRVKR